LVLRFGKEAAENEFRWMQQAVQQRKASLTMEAMIERRLGDEPLQYILGAEWDVFLIFYCY
jgi:methylase of polypeptide subunit release factors